MIRRLLDLLGLLSLLLCGAVVALWVRSFGTVDVVGRILPDGDAGQVAYAVASGGGVLKATRARVADFRVDEDLGVFWNWIAADDPGTLGVRWDRQFGKDHGPLAFGAGFYSGGSERRTGLWFPHWALAILAGALPGRRLVLAVRRRLRRPGHASSPGFEPSPTPGGVIERQAAPTRQPPARKPFDALAFVPEEETWSPKTR